MLRPALIIEDDADIAESVRYNLESAGFKTLVAATGEHGLSLALDTRNPPAVIVLDLMLPGMNGIEICRRLRRENQTRRTPIIMLTAKTSEAERVAGLDVGADDYIGKPFSVNELLARVRAVVGDVQAHSTFRQQVDAAGVSVYEGAGDARFVDSHTIETSRPSLSVARRECDSGAHSPWG